jgi:hypothetical protein
VTRAQFIHQYVLDACRLSEFDPESTFSDATFVADLLEKSGIASWDSAHGPLNVWNAGGLSGLSDRQLETVAYQIRDAEKSEREACAQIAAGYGAYAGALDATRAANEIAAEIRARGK